MARPSFTTTIPGAYTTKINDGAVTSTSVTSRNAREIVSGPPRRQVPSGWKPPVSYELRREVWKVAQGTHRYSRTNRFTGITDVREEYTGHIGGGARGMNSLNAFDETYTPKGLSLKQEDLALTQARLKLKGADVNLAVAFAERDKTARLVGDTALQLVEAMRKLRQRDWRGACRALDLNPRRKPRGSSVPARWLELQYGWKPLLSDVYGSVDALARRRGDDWIVTAKGASSEAISEFWTPNPPGANPLALPNYGYGRATGVRGCFVRIDAIPKNDLLMVMASLGITNPLLVAWELVPYSFVVDWFLPIGSFVDSLDALLGYGEAWTSISHLEKVDWVHTPSSREFSNVFYRFDHRLDTDSATKQLVNLKRTASKGVPMAQFPRLKDPVSLGHMANGLSLLTQVFRSGGRR